MTSAEKLSSDVFDDDHNEAVGELSQKVFGRDPVRVAFPGGKSRSAFIADMGDANYVFAKRDSLNDAQLEGIILRTLGNGNFVPKLKAVVQDWVVQEFVEGIRLPLLLHETQDMAERKRLIALSLDGLLGIHRQAHAENLQHRVPKVGTVDNWLWDRTGAAKRISIAADIKVPDLNRDALIQIMDVKRDEFIKWDARPGNAMIDGDQVCWFDWEECGRSKALDDLAFVLCDEWTNLDAESEAELKDLYFPHFNKSLSDEKGWGYLHVFGVTHMILRLRMALKLYEKKKAWRDRDTCLQGDKVGTTPEEVTNLINKIRRWSESDSLWQPLQPWLVEVEAVYLS